MGGDEEQAKEMFDKILDEIREKDYDLSFNKYKIVDIPRPTHRATSEIFADIENTYEESKNKKSKSLPTL